MSHIQSIGYDHCSCSQRATEDILKEIYTYREWNHEFKLEGIFIDEAPSDPALLPCMASLANHVQSSWSTLDRHSLVIYNPGVFIDGAFFNCADYVVTFEQSWDHWNLLHSAEQAVPPLAQDLCPKALAIIHSFVNAGDHLEKVIEKVRGMGVAGLYITEQDGGGCTWWPNAWHGMGLLPPSTEFGDY